MLHDGDPFWRNSDGTLNTDILVQLYSSNLIDRDTLLDLLMHEDSDPLLEWAQEVLDGTPSR